jgi:lipooligosaccharide transport system permease protein
MFGVKWGGTYHAAVSTPIEAREVYLGQLTWTGVRTSMSATVFLAIAAILGGVPSFWGVLAIPAAVLGALAIAAPLSAWAIERESDGAFSVVLRIVVFPLFLFSGTFFPISRLPDWLEPLVLLSPLYHAVELCRAATTGDLVFLDGLGNVAVLLVFIAVGVLWGERTFRKVLSL